MSLKKFVLPAEQYVVAQHVWTHFVLEDVLPVSAFQHLFWLAVVQVVGVPPEELPLLEPLELPLLEPELLPLELPLLEPELLPLEPPLLEPPLLEPEPLPELPPLLPPDEPPLPPCPPSPVRYRPVSSGPPFAHPTA
jgi:hypothetical protein